MGRRRRPRSRAWSTNANAKMVLLIVIVGNNTKSARGHHHRRPAGCVSPRQSAHRNRPGESRHGNGELYRRRDEFAEEDRRRDGTVEKRGGEKSERRATTNDAMKYY